LYVYPRVTMMIQAASASNDGPETTRVRPPHKPTRRCSRRLLYPPVN